MLIVVDKKNIAHIIDQTARFKHIGICGASCSKMYNNTLAMNVCPNICDNCQYFYDHVYKNNKNIFKSEIIENTSAKFIFPESYLQKYKSLVNYKFWNKLHKLVSSSYRPKIK